MTRNTSAYDSFSQINRRHNRFLMSSFKKDDHGIK